MTALERERLILDHMPQVYLIAKRIREKVPALVTLDDLISSGVVGLIAAIDRYDPEQEVKLKTYAEHKIRGAILDSLRRLDWAPRKERNRSKLIDKAIAELEKEHCRTPTHHEIATRLNLESGEYQKWLLNAKRPKLSSLNDAIAEERIDLLRCVADSEEHWPSRLMERSELNRELAAVIRRMPNIERQILSLYFYEEWKLQEIGKLLGLHASRISQLKDQAIGRLRSHVSRYWPEQGAQVA